LGRSSDGSADFPRPYVVRVPAALRTPGTLKAASLLPAPHRAPADERSAPQTTSIDGREAGVTGGFDSAAAGGQLRIRRPTVGYYKSNDYGYRRADVGEDQMASIRICAHRRAEFVVAVWGPIGQSSTGWRVNRDSSAEL